MHIVIHHRPNDTKPTQKKNNVTPRKKVLASSSVPISRGNITSASWK